MSACACNNEDITIIERVSVNPEHMLVLERAWTEYNALLALATQFTSDSPFKPDMERFDKVLNEFVKAFINYQITWNLVTAQCTTKYLLSGYMMMADFNTSEIIVYTKENNEGECRTCKL